MSRQRLQAVSVNVIRYLDKLGELVVCDLHVVHRIKERDAIGQSGLDFQHSLPCIVALVQWSEILRHEYPDTADRLDRRQKNRHDERLSTLGSETRLDATWCGRGDVAILRHTRALRAIEEHVDNVLLTRRDVLDFGPNSVLGRQ